MGGWWQPGWWEHKVNVGAGGVWGWMGVSRRGWVAGRVRAARLQGNCAPPPLSASHVSALRAGAQRCRPVAEVTPGGGPSMRPCASASPPAVPFPAIASRCAIPPALMPPPLLFHLHRRPPQAIHAPERQRIERAGSFVSGDGRLGGRVEVSRALGDRQFKRSGMSAVPDVQAFQLGPRDTFLMLGCDGFWGGWRRCCCFGCWLCCRRCQCGCCWPLPTSLPPRQDSCWTPRKQGPHACAPPSPPSHPPTPSRCLSTSGGGGLPLPSSSSRRLSTSGGGGLCRPRALGQRQRRQADLQPPGLRSDPGARVQGQLHCPAAAL